MASVEGPHWSDKLFDGIKPYIRPGPLGALFLGISSGFPYAMLAATLQTRLSKAGIQKSSISAFALALLVYSLKWLWAPIVDRVTIPVFSRRFGQRRTWLWLSGLAVMTSVALLGAVDPASNLRLVACAAVLVGFCGATFDIVIDAYRIETLSADELGPGSGMSQYGWRIGAATASALALIVAARSNWSLAYLACAPLALSALGASLALGEPRIQRPASETRGLRELIDAFVSPLKDFFRRKGAAIILLFVLVHKVGDTMANLMTRDLLVSLRFTNDEIAFGDVGVGFFALLAGIFAGGILYSRLGMQRSLMISLILMAVSNLSFAALAASGHSMPLLAFTIGFENFASGMGGVTVVAYLSALCSTAFTATQFALLSAAAAVLGRLLTGSTAGALIEKLGYVNFYLLTTVIALPGVAIYWYMIRSSRTTGDGMIANLALPQQTGDPK